MISNEDKENSHLEPTPDESGEEVRLDSEGSPIGSPGQEKEHPSTLPAPTQSVPIAPVEQAIPPSDPSAEMVDVQERTEPAVPLLPDVDQAESLPADAPATEPLMEVIVPAETSKTETNVSGLRKTTKKVIAVGGAKGGVGKSMFSANVAVGLALLGQKVVLADLDLGGADVHLYTGVKSLARTWNDFLDKKVNSIEDILTPTAFEGLSLIGGDSTRLGSANLPYPQKLKIMRHLKELEADFLVIDLGGDTTYNGLDFFLLADQKIVVTTTDPASVLDSYAFIKVLFNRFLERFFSEYKSLKDLAEQIRDGSLEKSEKYSLDFIYQEVRARDPGACVQLKEQFDQFRLSVVLNMTESPKELRIAESMQKLVKEKCFLDIGILGTIPLDSGVRKAARGFTPIVVENPKCQASRNIHQMLAAILLHGEGGATQAELLQATSRIRREAKEQIDSSKMTLDGLTFEQINAASNNAPWLRQSFQKILNIMSG